MVTRITAEFESPESAELALKRIRENIRGVYSTSYVYNKQSDKAERIRGKDIYTIMPTAVVTQNYLTGVIDSPASIDSIPEPSRSRKTTVFIVCDGSGTGEISSVLSNSGAVNIDSPAI